jgi:hypothetical protein
VSIDGLAPARGDAARLRELLDQLIDNAFKYTAAVTHPYVDLGSVDGEGGPVYYVRDNGAGFDMRRAGRLFHDLDGPNGSEGLALVQRVVEEHGGRVWAEGRIDGGATFFFTLHEPLRIGPPREPGHVDFGRALESATGVGLDRPAVRPS